MGARVSVDSLPGKGTTFTIRVAIADETPADTESAPAGGAGNGARAHPESLNILIVDDELRVLELLPPLLEPHRVETANRSAEGLERVRRGGYDIVISDWIMAEVSGLELASEVKATSPETVVILMTGWDFKNLTAIPNPSSISCCANPSIRKLWSRS